MPIKQMEISDADKTAWKEAVEDVTVISHKSVAPQIKPKTGFKAEREQTVPLKLYHHELKLGTSADIDANTMRRFKREEFAVEASLDLHGYTEERAYNAVCKFVTQAYLSGKRCILIVTGKGLQHHDEDIFAPKGVLKERVPQWLGQDNLKQLILSYIHPSPKLGGSGALYILLRRHREKA